jgi:pyruvate,water dikinase
MDGMRPESIENLKRRQEEISGKARKEVFARVPFYLRPLLRRLIPGASRETVLREMARSTLARVVLLGRVVALECARRFINRDLLSEVDDVFFLSWEEVQAVLTGESDGRGLRALAMDSRSRCEELEELTPPDYLEEDAPHLAEQERTFDGETLSGIGVAAGRAEGPARVIRKPTEGSRLLEGDVLVAPATDPAWTPLFLRASALVMETGGTISHGAIVAREYGIPAVINVPGVLRVLTDGTGVLVDGDEGKVYLRRSMPMTPMHPRRGDMPTG